jgi:hypothetical protein
VNKYVQPRPYADPEPAARTIVELANGLAPYMDGRLLIERINGPLLFELKGAPAECKGRARRAIEKGWLFMHESCLRFTEAGGDLFA